MNRRGTNQDAVQKAKAYIDKNYADPDLSLRMLAELVDLSPAYLGKIFTMVTTFSFNDYLNNVRTGKAAELLSTTKLPISRISEEVGILNTNYFYSVFKKRYGHHAGDLPQGRQVPEKGGARPAGGERLSQPYYI